MRIIFMGTPEFAVSILAAIHQSRHQIIGVVTAPDKPAGRGRKLKASAVKEYALQQELKILQPLNLRDPQFLDELKALEADLFVVVAFRMLPEAVWSLPKEGTINLHASLLPQYRGAAPINWAIVNGEEETGLSTFFINENIDTGDILLQEKLAIGPNENAGSLHDRMMVAGANLVLDTLDQIEGDNLKPLSQASFSEDELIAAPKIYKESLRIDWSKSLLDIHNLIRGMSPYPGAWTELVLGEEKTNMKILAAQPHYHSSSKGFKSLYREGKKLFIGLKDSKLELIELQIQGKKRLKALDFLNGQEITENDHVL